MLLLASRQAGPEESSPRVGAVPDVAQEHQISSCSLWQLIGEEQQQCESHQAVLCPFSPWHLKLAVNQGWLFERVMAAFANAWVESWWNLGFWLSPGSLQKLCEEGYLSANPPWGKMLALEWLRCAELPAGQRWGILRGCARGWLQDPPTGPCPRAVLVFVLFLCLSQEEVPALPLQLCPWAGEELPWDRNCSCTNPGKSSGCLEALPIL